MRGGRCSTNFGDGSLAGSPVLTGHADGALPATVTLDNRTAFNDYFEGFKFGSTLAFNVSLFGPALSAPDGVSTSGSTFAFSMFSNAAGTIPALTTDELPGIPLKVGDPRYSHRLCDRSLLSNIFL